VRCRTKGNGAVDLGVQGLYRIAELLFKIHVIFVIVCIKLLISTSHFVFVFILKILD